jgi:glutaredoxin
MKIEIYSKADCSLCDEAKQALLQVQQRIPFELVEVDIEKDPALFERFRYDIPVVFINGQKSFKHRIDARQLESRLIRERGTGVAQSGGMQGNGGSNS